EITDEITADISELGRHWLEVEKFAARRIADPLHGGTNSALDIAYDMELDKALELADDIEILLRQVTAHEVAGFERDRIYLISTAVLAMLLALLVLWRVDAVRRKNAEFSVEAARSRDASQKSFRNLFDLSPVSLWLEDFSKVKAHVRSLQDSGVGDLRAYCDAHPDGLMECAGLVDILDVNQATLRLHGADSKDQLLADLSHTFTDESFEVFREELLALMDGQTEMTHQARVRQLDGTPVDVMISARVMPGHEQALDRVLVALTDISETVKAERALRASSEMLELAQQAGSVGMWDWNPQTGALVWTEETYRIFGLQAGSVQPSFDLFVEHIHPDDRDAVQAAVQAALERDVPYHAQCR
ncbi:MAG: PAS domain-containing protein, partial [Mariprofundaceae bacterium]|nr:PAS domain-containing protein [Mariprofundaceae bacterium]